MPIWNHPCFENCLLRCCTYCPPLGETIYKLFACDDVRLAICFLGFIGFSIGCIANLLIVLLQKHIKRKKSIITLFLAAVSVVSCEPPMPPSDEEMIRHFNTHEAAFSKVYEIMADCTEGSFHYPPLSPDGIIILDPATQEIELSDETNEEQDIPVYGLLKPERILLDSLLAEIGCGLVLVDRQELEMVDSLKLSLVMPYYSNGLAISGTSKSFVYDPGLSNHPVIRITEQGDLNEIYRRTYNDTTLYKPIKGNWYIKLDHER